MKKILLAVFAIGLAVLIWFLFIKEFDYRVDFKSKHSVWISNAMTQKWSHTKWKKDTMVTNLPNAVSIYTDSLDYHIEFEHDNDSITQIKFYSANNEAPFIKRFKWLLGQGNLSDNAKELAKDLKLFLEVGEENYILGKPRKTQVPEMHYAYVNVESTVADKARSMMLSIVDVMEYIKDNDIEIIGDPFIKVTHWDIEAQKVTYKFCFPIQKQDQYPPTEIVRVEKSLPFTALHTKFNGDYRFSSYAWFQLVDFARKEKIDVEELPLEIFRNDPHAGGNSLEWVADVYLPLK